MLIADDSNFILDRLQQLLLSLEDVAVIGSFHNGTDALNALCQLKPDLYHDHNSHTKYFY